MRMLHHPYCTKSCSALEFLSKNQINAEITDLTRYFPSREELIELIEMLEIPVIELIRTNEPVFIKKYLGKELNDEEWIEVILENPILLQRPIFIEGNKAVIGRPPERIFELYK